MSESPQKSALEEIAAILQDHNVEFIVIGGQAEWAYGSSRFTADVDLCYRRTPQNIERLAEALKLLKPKLRNAPPDVPFIIDARTLTLGNNFTLTTPFIDLDLLGWVEPIGDYDALLISAESASIGGMNFKIINLDDLIRIKQHIGRAKDRESLQHLLAIKKLREETGSS